MFWLPMVLLKAIKAITSRLDFYWKPKLRIQQAFSLFVSKIAMKKLLLRPTIRYGNLDSAIVFDDFSILTAGRRVFFFSKEEIE